jgi:hypothetical protein
MVAMSWVGLGMAAPAVGLLQCGDRVYGPGWVRTGSSLDWWCAFAGALQTHWVWLDPPGLVCLQPRPVGAGCSLPRDRGATGPF